MTITARNYAAQARRMIGAYVQMYEDGKCGGAAEDRELELALTRAAAEKMDSAVHFALPDGALLFEDDLRGLRGQSLKLPYPAVTLEWYQPPSVDLSYPSKMTKFVAIAFEVTNEDFPQLEQDERAIMVMGAREHEAEWCPSTAFAVIPEAWERRVLGAQQSRADNRGKVYVWGITHYNGMVQKMGQEAADDALDRDIATELYTVLQFCEAMSCSNVGTEVISGASASVNARRLKDGKVPLLDTKVLTVHVPGATSTRIGLSRKTGEIRQHLRRGHVRNLSDGRRIWVNSCVVGNPEKGRIEKGYRVLPEAPLA